MRRLIALLFFATAAAQAAVVTNVVDLDAPGALQALRDARPAHYAKVQAILAMAVERPRAGVEKFIEARFDASDVEMLLWRVSDPPKLRVGFTLDSTRYTADVVPALPPVRALPAR